MLDTAQPKPPRGEHADQRDANAARRRTAEDKAKAAARKRDGWGCRWPETHTCKGGDEVAHIFHDKGMGGDHGLVSDTWNLMTLCAARHRLRTPSIHGKLLKVEPETPKGADAACSFWRRATIHDEWICVGVEIRIGVLRKL